MNAVNIAEYSQTLGLQARTASGAMAKAEAAQRNRCLRTLAGLLRQDTAALQSANNVDLERATAAGLSAPMVDRLRLTPKVLETVAQGCEQLAAMHAHTAAGFGWDRDNTIGATPQPNQWTRDWVTFLREQRIGHQLGLARDNGLPAATHDRVERVQSALPRLFDVYQPQPSLLHGDLWGGNWAVESGGHPVVFDPAVYYGDREADLAMTELFGGFDRGFYEAYRRTWPLDPGYDVRRDLYQLYHILNHFNLFGGGYAGQVRALADRLLANC